MNRLSLYFSLLRVLALAAGLWLAAPVQAADEYTEVRDLHRAGKTSQALERAGSYIAANPGDPQMRFIKATILSASQRDDEAEALLQELTRDNPELPEPWNNLAVLHAARGQLDKALEELQTAVRLNASYATALENLGDVQARLAVQAYERARKLDSGNRRLPAKIELLRNLFEPAAVKPAASEPLR